MNEQTIHNLLNQCLAVKKEYDKIAKITGENYNIFKLLKLTTNEVKTHSAFIGDLLDPKGSHGLGNVFLKEFCTIIEIEFDESENADYVLEVEKHISRITETYEEGGRIDIIIKDKIKGHCIIIENKIHAPDGNNQLTRYYNFNPKADLIYLTLDGDLPSKASTRGLAEEVIKNMKRISYKATILAWLEVSKKHAVDHSLLRETITQYINLIKYLTNKTSNKDMEKDISEIITNSNSSLEAAFLLTNNIDAAKALLLNKLEQQLMVRSQSSSKISLHEYRLTAKIYSGFEFTSDLLLENNIFIKFQAQSQNVNSVLFGIFHKYEDGKIFQVEPKLKERIFSLVRKPDGVSPHAICYWNYRDQNWDNFETYSKILSGKLADEIVEQVLKLVNICEQAINEEVRVIS